ncbi:MAG: histidinol-phosphatase [Nitrospirales bacterium]|nr:histidinol-phosphatase [Nitrospirales bacterium]
MPKTNYDIANVFLAMAELLAAQSANPYRIQAYRRVAQTLASLTEDIQDIAQRDELDLLPTIGKESSAKIHEYLRTGNIRAYENLKTPLPDAILPWTTLPGFSEPLVQDLYRHLHITTLDDLEKLARSHLLQTRVGPSTTTEELVQAIQQLRKNLSAN